MSNPDTLLQHIRGSVKKWANANETATSDAAARDIINAFENLDAWLSTGGRLPAVWNAARAAEGPDPDYIHDGVIAERPGGFLVTLANKPCGTQTSYDAACIALEREMSHKDYWPYAWHVKLNRLNAPTLLDVPARSERVQYHWWIASRPSEDEFTFASSHEIDAEKVQETQADLNRRNADAGFLQWKILRGDQVSR